RVRAEDAVRLRDDVLDGRLAHGLVGTVLELAEVDVHPHEVAALARDEEDVAGVVRLDRALDLDGGEVGVREAVEHATRVHRRLALELVTERVAHSAARAVATDEVLRPDDALLALAGAGDVLDARGDGVLVLVVDLQVDELDAVVRHDAPRRALGVPEEVVED